MFVGKNFSLFNVYIAKAFKQTSIYKKNVRAKKLIWKTELLQLQGGKQKEYCLHQKPLKPLDNFS